MIVLDTSGLLAALDQGARHHDAARAAIETDPGPYLLSPLVLAELDYLIAERMGIAAEIRYLRDVAVGAYQLEPISADDIETATDVIERYVSMAIGAADASVVVIAARARTTRILTLDERHFRALRPLRGRSFRLLPADA
ncbi:MAG: PIN domain-containing protein [Actinomycetota bacterium]